MCKKEKIIEEIEETLKKLSTLDLLRTLDFSKALNNLNNKDK